MCAQTDPEAFFPEKGGSTREAKKVCLTCDVRDECLEYALMNDERFGIWGGLSERERRKLKKRGSDRFPPRCGRPARACPPAAAPVASAAASAVGRYRRDRDSRRARRRARRQP